MRIVNVTPGLLPIPPNGWGAVEKIIWEYHQNLKLLGHDSHIKYLNDVKPGEYDVVHIHVANLALIAKERGIPYYFSFHDHHAYLHGKQSANYKENKAAIEGSIKSFVPAKYLVDYFESDKVEYFSHGVNPGFFTPCSCPRRTQLLCVANNGWAHDPSYDRKGFRVAIEAAKALDKSITVAGPLNNQKFFKANQDLLEYSKLTVLYDLSEDDLADLYRKSEVFIHCSELEAGHPNLTLLEAMASGIPVVGTYEVGNKLEGMIRVEPKVDQVVAAVKNIYENFYIFSEEAKAQAQELSWENRVKELVKIYQREPKKSSRGHVYHTLGNKVIDLRQYNYEKSQGEVERESGWEACMYWANIYHHELDNAYFSIEPGDIYVDIGANIGMNATYAELKGASKIYCAEPEPDVFKALQKNAGPNWVVDNLAVWDTNSIIQIGKWPNAEIKTYARSVTLQWFLNKHSIDKIDYLKIDIEGAEKGLIPSIDPAIWPKVKKIFIEYHEDHFGFSDEARNEFINSITKYGFNSAHQRGGNQTWMYFWRQEETPKPKQTEMKDVLINAYNTTTVAASTPQFPEPVINYNFINGAYVEVLTPEPTTFNINIIDMDKNAVAYTSTVSNNSWVKSSQQFYTNYSIQIEKPSDGSMWVRNMSLKDEPVLIELTSKSLGDTLAWAPYAEEFRKKHDCKVICSTFLPELFRDQYPEIQWVGPGSYFERLYAHYQIGWWYNEDGTPDLYKTAIDFKSFPLQETATRILGLEYKEIRPKLSYKFGISARPVAEKYVCIAVHSTSQAKYWNNPTGWQELVDYLKATGYKVVLLSSEPDGHQGNKNPEGVLYPGDYQLQTIMWYLYHSEFFVGLGSGLSWLSWAMNKTTVLISGFSEAYTEMQDCIRIGTPDGHCRGCFNWVRLQNDGYWNWCPKHFVSERQFECTKVITSQMVIDKIKPLIHDTSNGAEGQEPGPAQSDSLGHE